MVCSCFMERFPVMSCLQSKQNLLVNQEDGSDKPTLWISDFGLSGIVHGCQMNQSSNITKRCFTTDPELYKLQTETSEQVSKKLMQMGDVYSFAVVLYYVSSDPAISIQVTQRCR
jgi:hypothetical protein